MRSPARPVALAAALALAVCATGCGSGDGDAKPATTTTATSSQGAVGLGFTVDVPPRWTNVADQLNVGSTRYDVAAADTTASGFKKTVTIDRRSGQLVAGQTLDTLDATARKAVAGTGVTVHDGPPVTVGGQQAKDAVFVSRQDGQRLAAHTVTVLHKGELYLIRLVAKADDQSAEKILRTMLGTWHWTR